MRAISSVGQSYRLITGWSKVRALDGPPTEKATQSGGFFLLAGYRVRREPTEDCKCAAAGIALNFPNCVGARSADNLFSSPSATLTSPWWVIKHGENAGRLHATTRSCAMKSDVERGKLLKDNLPPRRSLGSERLDGLLFSHPQSPAVTAPSSEGALNRSYCYVARRFSRRLLWRKL